MESSELEDLRRDIVALRAAIDAALSRGSAGQDPLIRASAAALQDRLHRLEQLEETAGPGHT